MKKDEPKLTLINSSGLSLVDSGQLGPELIESHKALASVEENLNDFTENIERLKFYIRELDENL